MELSQKRLARSPRRTSLEIDPHKLHSLFNDVLARDMNPCDFKSYNFMEMSRAVRGRGLLEMRQLAELYIKRVSSKADVHTSLLEMILAGLATSGPLDKWSPGVWEGVDRTVALQLRLWCSKQANKYLVFFAHVRRLRNRVKFQQCVSSMLPDEVLRLQSLLDMVDNATPGETDDREEGIMMKRMMMISTKNQFW